MRISHVEIQNFRKLKSVRIDLSKATTLLVGANNSGKTSAMIALRSFLIDQASITINDFTLSNWSTINEIGERWQSQNDDGAVPAATKDEWNSVLPALDVWLQVEDTELHLVRHLIPTLDWSGGGLGVRLQFEPKDPSLLQQEFLSAVDSAKTVRTAATTAGDAHKTYTLSLWPENLLDFLERKLRPHFTKGAYILDPAHQVLPFNGVAQPQQLAADVSPLERDPFEGLIVINDIAAHRGMEDSWGRGGIEGGDQQGRRDRHKLSEQLRSYYQAHLDPSDDPDPADLDALQSIEDAQKSFDERLASGFKAAIDELEGLNYPGVADPRLKIATRVRPQDGLNHQSAVKYEVDCKTDGDTRRGPLRLPEDYNGLGFQNLISMVFKLMSFRDSWLKVGKAGKRAAASNSGTIHPPLHLVLVEEPEAHLHIQVQQVFVKKAYEVLCNHPSLQENSGLNTQLVVSTHSGHVAHECQFESLRYFRRVPPSGLGDVPTATVINLSEVFGVGDETARFVARYLKSTHCELFFADAAILVEGQAERILIPHFIRKRFQRLDCRFITLLEIGGSHAHRLQSLIEHLGLITLVICDLDARDGATKTVVSPERAAGQLTGNPTLVHWHPKLEKVDELLALADKDKQLALPDGHGFVRFEFQLPVQVKLRPAQTSEECLATTFEDALILENVELLAQLTGVGMLKKVITAIDSAADVQALRKSLFEIVRKGDKGEFALDLLWADKPHPPVETLRPPSYIAKGLTWLDDMLKPEEGLIVSHAPGVAS